MLRRKEDDKPGDDAEAVIQSNEFPIDSGISESGSPGMRNLEKPVLFVVGLASQDCTFISLSLDQ